LSLTGQAILTAFSVFLDDYWASTSDGAGTATTLVDSALKRFGDKANEEAFVRLVEDSTTPGNIWLVRRISNFQTDTLTWGQALPQAVESGKDYEIHRWDPAKKFRAIDRARILAFPQVAKIVVDETYTSDGESREIPIPTAIRRGPAQVWYEEPLDKNPRWNLLGEDGELANADAWTANGLTAATYTRADSDYLIPKYDDSCVKLTGGASSDSLRYTLSAAQAALYAGRRLSFGAWVYSRTAGSTVSITDDAGTATSSTHAGLGWQYLSVSKNIDGANATLLRVDINPVTDNAVYVQRALFGAVDRITVPYPHGPIPRHGVHRDDDEANLYLSRSAPRGYQYRLVGRTPVSALGTTPATQVTNTMEIGEADQDLLLATAARILLTWEGMSSGAMEEAFPQIAIAESRFKELKEDWERRYPRASYVDLG